MNGIQLSNFSTVWGWVGVANQSTKSTQKLNAEETAIINILVGGPLYLEELVSALYLDTSQVTATLLLMEMKGLVRHLGQTKYSKV